MRLTLNGLLLERDSDELHVLGVEAGSTLIATFESTVKVTRHVYARGGKGCRLTATDTVELVPCMALGKQMSIIVPHGGFKGKGKDQGKVFVRPCGDEPPRTWKGQGVEIDLTRSPVEVFGSAERDVVVLIPMMGMD